jgi:hypothetical protein
MPHPVRLFRLSCGCLREYPMMPSGLEHTVLCVTCRASSVTVAVYPEKACGRLGWAWTDGGIRVRASCTLPAGCRGPVHADRLANVEFAAGGPRLWRSNEGRTGRA